VAVAAGVLLLGVTAARIVLTWKTPDGVVTVQVDPPDAMVEVTEGAITVRPKGAAEPYTITVAKGGGKLRVSKAGFVVQSREVTLNDKGQTLTVALKPVEPPAVPMPAPKPTEPPNVPKSEPVAPSVADKAPGNDGFVPLFNGKDLTGWKALDGTSGGWSVQDGHIVCGWQTSLLYSDRDDFKNFHIRAEVLIGDKSNSGILIRARKPLETWYEVEIRTETGRSKTGDIYVAGTFMSSVGRNLAPPQQWFTLDIIAIDNHIITKVNGITAKDIIDASRRSSRGCIALQKYTPETQVRFRKIEIKELP
jgi:hypothetical protein